MTVALCLVVVLDVVLIYLALQPRESPGAASVAVRPGPTSTEPAPSPTSTPTPTAQPVVGVPASRLLDAVSAEVAWRATAGTCPGGGAVVERTEDGGETWVPVDPTLGAYVRLKVSTPREAFVVGQSAEDCEPAFADTRSGGDQWRQVPRSLDVAWFVDPDDRSRVHSSQGYLPGPCGGPVVDLAPRTTTDAAVLCPDGGLYETQDAGNGWTQRAAVPGAVAVTDHGDGSALAVLGSPGCDGVAVATVPTVLTAPTVPTVPTPTGTDVEVVGCAAGVSARPDQVAISSTGDATGDAVWLWVGAEVRQSVDGAATWS